jgi:hypothetical protein
MKRKSHANLCITTRTSFSNFFHKKIDTATIESRRKLFGYKGGAKKSNSIKPPSKESILKKLMNFIQKLLGKKKTPIAVKKDHKLKKGKRSKPADNSRLARVSQLFFSSVIFFELIHFDRK